MFCVSGPAIGLLAEVDQKGGTHPPQGGAVPVGGNPHHLGDALNDPPQGAALPEGGNPHHLGDALNDPPQGTALPEGGNPHHLGDALNSPYHH